MKQSPIISVFVLALACVVSAKLPRYLNKHKEAFEQFKAEHGKSYSSENLEFEALTNFALNMERIEALNQNTEDTAEYGPNQYTDLNIEELDGIAFGFKLPENYTLLVKNEWLPFKYFEKIMSKNIEIPESLDWRQTEGRVSEVKNQGRCGSCWAFSTTGLLEGQEVDHKTNKEDSRSIVNELSEQDLTDCSKQNYGCDGGLMNLALQDIAELGGIESEKDYPYRGKDGICRFDKTKSVMTDKGAFILEGKNEEKLKELVAKYGPVAVAIHASKFNFMFYKKGVFYDKHCRNEDTSLNHAVLVVGYGHETKGGDYWIVKNSWGESFGEQGYIRMARNKKNMCGIASMPTIATF